MELRVRSGIVHVVDDNASFRKAMERRLMQAGYEVSTYPSAQHLLDCVPSESVPGCILLDVRIPGLSGPELQERLSAAYHIPHWASRYSNHSANHQGRCGGFFDQAGIIACSTSGNRAGDCAS